jgi:hypothetical protein
VFALNALTGANERASLPIRRNRKLARLRLPPPRVNQVGVNIMASRKLRNASQPYSIAAVARDHKAS